MLNFLTFRNAQRIEHADHLLGTEQSHQIVFQGNIESGFTGVSLTTGTTAQLIVDTAGFMTLGTDDFQTACCLCFFIQLDIRTTACHVGRDRYRSVRTCLCYDLSLQLMVFRV